MGEIALGKRLLRHGKISLFGVAALLLALQTAGCSPERAIEAGRVLADLSAGRETSSLKETTPRPRRTVVSILVEGRRYSGDLYLPGEKPGGTVLLVPGAAEQGKNDPRLVAFAETLARARFKVLVPDLPGLRELQTSPDNVGQIRDLFFWLTSEQGPGTAEASGIIAFSYAAGPAILAALDPAVGSRIDFILAVGTYFDLPETLTFFTTGYFPTPTGWRHLTPNVYGKWIFVLSNLHFLADPHDRVLFREMAARKTSDLDARLEDLAAELSEEGQSLYRFITNSDPELTPRLLRSLPERIRQDIRALDLATKDLSALRTRLILVHGRHDAIIPYTQSIRLAKALPDNRTHLVLLEGLSHVDMDLTLADHLNLWRVIYLLLKERAGK